MPSSYARASRAVRFTSAIVLCFEGTATAQCPRAPQGAEVRTSERRLRQALDEAEAFGKAGQRAALLPVAAGHLARVCRARCAACEPERRRFLRLWRATAGRVTSRADAAALIDAFDVLLRERVLHDPTPPRRLARLFGLTPND